MLLAAAVPLVRLARQLYAGPSLARWRLLAVLHALFFCGYVGYAAAFWGEHAGPAALIVPGVFFFGACFVWLTHSLALHMALDVRRLPLLERESVTDELTGLFNRRYADRRLEEEVSRARRHGLPLSVLMADIDHFKRVNDERGHPAGDRVLAQVAKAILDTVRGSDVAARWGGEEFLVIATETKAVMAVLLGERLRRRVETRVQVSVSVGVADLGEGEDAAALVARVDRALYRAKAQGRNRVVAAPDAGDE